MREEVTDLTCSIYYGVNLYLDLWNVNKFNSMREDWRKLHNGELHNF
jgi:hypothetical protein